ncbi:MAG TPA: hypothetical protein VN813_14610 [Luteibacter sp.]|nr:hypothetical protein [Luteibacter sp.]
MRFDRDAGAIVSHPGRFRIREVPVDRIVRVEAGNSDKVAHDGVFLFFHVDGEDTLVVSEFDKGFTSLVHDLRLHFPGIEQWQRAVPPVAFQLTSVDLWKRTSPNDASVSMDEAANVGAASAAMGARE